MRARIAIVLLLIWLAGCRSRRAPPPPPPSTARDAAVASVLDAGAPAVDQAATVRGEADALLARWLDVQNRGDFAGYTVLYQRNRFRGIKRTHKGGVRTYDGPGWTRDRKRMFAVGFTVAAERLAIETWRDHGSKLKPGIVSLRFTQRWRGGGYADHGVKVLQAYRDPKRGLLLVYEDLLNAEPGWDDAGAAAATLALAPPADDAAALALWAKLAPTGATYEQVLAALPDDAAVTRPMARALIAAGGFACDKTVESGSCGQDIVEWAPLEPTATIDDPCLRRRLALWALPELSADDARGLADALAAMMKLTEPEEDLPAAVFDAIPAGDDQLRLTLMKAAIDAGRGDLADKQADDLAHDDAIVSAARDLSLDAAVDRLDPKTHRAERIAALGDGEVSSPVRARLIVGFASDRGADVTAALISLTADEDCELAMAAADALAARGDPRYLPRRPAANDEIAFRRALCLLAYDPDGHRQAARWAEFLASEVILRDATENQFDGDDEDRDDWDQEQGASEGGEDAPSGRSVSRGEIGSHVETWTTDPRATVTIPDSLGRWARGEDEPLEIRIDAGADGRLRIEEITTKHWNGCPC